MTVRILTPKVISDFKFYLEKEEKSENTVEKYIRDVKAFAEFLNNNEVTKESVIEYKNKLICENYAVRSINSMLASVNGLLAFLGWHGFRVKSIKLQRQIYCPEEKRTHKSRIFATCEHRKRKWKRTSEPFDSNDMFDGNQSERVAVYYG